MFSDICRLCFHAKSVLGYNMKQLTNAIIDSHDPDCLNCCVMDYDIVKSCSWLPTSQTKVLPAPECYIGTRPILVGISLDANIKNVFIKISYIPSCCYKITL